jgi:EmrB/QacA subfamily drug resistance transporter
MNRERSKPLVLISLLMAAFVINLDTTLVNNALPTLTRELGATNTQLQWVVDAYNLVFAALLLTSGSISDRFGRKGMLMAGLGVFGVASFVGGFGSSPGELIAARAVMGMGAAMTFPATLSLLTNVFTERKERALAIGLWGATSGAAIALGPIVGGFLLQHFSWSSVFFTLGPVAGVSIALVAIFSPSSKDPRPHPLDGAGFVLSAAFMGLIVYTIIEAPNRGWGSSLSIAGFVASVVLLGLFVAQERRTEHPMLDVRLFKNMRFTAASGSVTIAFFTLFGFIFLITQYFQFIHNYSALSAGVRLLPVAVSVAVGSIVGTRLAVRFGTKAIVTIGLLATAIFYLWVWRVISTTTSYDIIAMQMVLYGLGMGLTSAPATESIMGAVSAAQAGVGSADNDSTRLLGGTLGVAVIGSIYASLYGNRLDKTLPSQLPTTAKAVAHQSVGGAYGISAHLASSGQHVLAQLVHDAASNAFIRGISISCLVTGVVALVGALLPALFLPAQPPSSPNEPALDLDGAETANLAGAPAVASPR